MQIWSPQPCEQGPTLDVASSFNFFSFSFLLVSFQWSLSWIFVTPPSGGWMVGLSPSFPCDF
jgi:hypothetical protein